MNYQGSSNELLLVESIDNKAFQLLETGKPHELTIVWFQDELSQINIDTESYSFKRNEVLCLTEFHKLKVQNIGEAKIIRFNKAFYCILDHDSDVSCKGILFFGASRLPLFHIPEADLETFELLYALFEVELNTKDHLQQEMLQMMLKRFLILCARLYKKQYQYDTLEKQQTDIVREYHFLVEQHFKTKHSVAEYAAMLHKSPKTLSNLFSKLSSKTPLQYIQDRLILEARRLLRYTDRSIKEIAYEIGFEDPQTFGRFFKNIEQMSPKEYRERK